MLILTRVKTNTRLKPMVSRKSRVKMRKSMPRPRKRSLPETS